MARKDTSDEDALADPSKVAGGDLHATLPEQSGETLEMRPGRVSGSEVLEKVSFLLRLGKMVRVASRELDLRRSLDLGGGRSAILAIELQDNFALRKDAHIPFTIVLRPQVRSAGGQWEEHPERKRPVPFDDLAAGDARESLDRLARWMTEEVDRFAASLRGQ